MFKLSITSRWALMAARGWARLILDRRRDLINDRPNRAAAAQAPLDGAQERQVKSSQVANSHKAQINAPCKEPSAIKKKEQPHHAALL